jgi:hypothetical protein
MAIAIKNIPILKELEAQIFENNINTSGEKKSSIDFSNQLIIASKILAKAKI